MPLAVFPEDCVLLQRIRIRGSPRDVRTQGSELLGSPDKESEDCPGTPGAGTFSSVLEATSEAKLGRGNFKHGMWAGSISISWKPLESARSQTLSETSPESESAFSQDPQAIPVLLKSRGCDMATDE